MHKHQIPMGSIYLSSFICMHCQLLYGSNVVRKCTEKQLIYSPWVSKNEYLVFNTENTSVHLLSQHKHSASRADERLKTTLCTSFTAQTQLQKLLDFCDFHERGQRTMAIYDIGIEITRASANVHINLCEVDFYWCRCEFEDFRNCWSGIFLYRKMGGGVEFCGWKHLVEYGPVGF